MNYQLSNNPKVFGPHYWYVLYSLANQINDNNLHQTCSLIKGVCDGLPCEKCKMHFNQYLSQNPLIATNKNDVMRWLKKLENNISERKTRPKPTGGGCGCKKRKPLNPGKLMYL